MKQIQQRQKSASLLHGAHLLSVRYHQSVLSAPILKHPPVFFEIEMPQNKNSVPEVAKRL